MVPVCRFENLKVHFGGVAALKGIGGAIYKDEVVAMVGPNGAGKTTFLNVLSGLVIPESGRVEFEGIDLLAAEHHQRSSIGIARSFQTPKLLEEESALVNVVCGAHACLNYGPWAQLLRRRLVSESEDRVHDTASSLLKEFNLAEYEKVVVSQLPFGVRKIVDLLRAVVQEPKMLLLDEPTAGMNASERDRVEEIIAHLRTRAMTVLVVEHHMRVVRSVADRVMVFEAGELVRVGSVQQTVGLGGVDNSEAGMPMPWTVKAPRSDASD